MTNEFSPSRLRDEFPSEFLAIRDKALQAAYAKDYGAFTQYIRPAVEDLFILRSLLISAGELSQRESSWIAAANYTSTSIGAFLGCWNQIQDFDSSRETALSESREIREAAGMALQNFATSEVRKQLGSNSAPTVQTREVIEANNASIRITKEAKEVVTRMETALREFEGAYATKSAEELAVHYLSGRDFHRKRSLIALGLATLLGLVAIGVGFYMTASIDTTSWHAQAKSTTLTVFVLGMLIFGVRLAVSSYRAHAHMAVACDEKVTALRTYPKLQAATSEPESRGHILAELVRVIFAPAATGFTTSDSDFGGMADTPASLLRNT